MTALAVFPNAAAGMMLLTRNDCIGLVGGGVFSICLNYALFNKLFDLEFGSAFLCTALTTFFALLSWVAILFLF